MLRSRLFLGCCLALAVVPACTQREPAGGRAPLATKPGAAPSVSPKAAPAPTARLPVPDISVPRGQALYASMCAVCHGASGEGYKADRAPALGHPDYLASVSDELLEVSILEGRRATTMSAWGRHRGGPLTPDDARDLVAFLRSWQKGPKAVLDDRPLHGDAARGQPIFERECTRCHGPGGYGGPNTQLADQHFLANASDGFLRYAIARGRPGTTMEGYAGKLGEQAIEDVIAFVRDASQKIAAELTAEQGAVQTPLELGPVPLNPNGPQARGFNRHPGTTPVDIVHAELARGARMALLDARAPSDYLQDHIAGAVSVPFYDPAPYLRALPKGAWLVCYCACPHAESQMLAQKLLDHGFTHVTVLDEGLGIWKMKGYPTRGGTDP